MCWINSALNAFSLSPYRNKHCSLPRECLELIYARAAVLFNRSSRFLEVHPSKMSWETRAFAQTEWVDVLYITKHNSGMATVYLFLFQIILPALEMAVVKAEKLQAFMDKRVLLQINRGREVRNSEFNLHGWFVIRWKAFFKVSTHSWTWSLVMELK